MTDHTGIVGSLSAQAWAFETPRERDVREACAELRTVMENPVISGTGNQTLHGQTIRRAAAEITRLRAEAEALRKVLQEARDYVGDARLYRHELDGRKRNETLQQHEDRISTWIQENEDRRNLLAALDATKGTT